MYVLLVCPIVAFPKLVGSVGTKLRVLQLLHTGIHSWFCFGGFVLVGNVTGNAKAHYRGGNNDEEAHLDNLAVVLSFRLFLCRRLIASHPKTAKEGHIAEGAMAVILVPQNIGIYGHRLRWVDVYRLNLDTWTSRGWTFLDGNAHYSFLT
jgi:hypothetical protein